MVASFRKLPILAKAKNIQESAGAARALVNGLQPELPQNSQHLGYHRWVAWLADWFGERMEYAEWIYNIRRKFAPEKRAPFQKRAVRWGRKLRQQIQKLAGRYELGAANLYLEIRYIDGTTRRVLSSEDWKEVVSGLRKAFLLSSDYGPALQRGD